MACHKQSFTSQNIDYTKYSHWDRSQALVRFEPVSSNRCCKCSSTAKRCHEVELCMHHTCSCEGRSRRSSKRRHRSSSRQRSSSRHSSSSRYDHDRSTGQHNRHFIPIEHHRHRGMGRVASARQSSFSVLSQSSAAVLSDHQRRQRLTNKSDEEVQNLVNALSKVGRRSLVQTDRKSLRRSAVIEKSQERPSIRPSLDGSQETNKAVENEALNTDINDHKSETMPLLSGSVQQQSRIGLFWPEKKRFLVLRQTCLEIYADESAYNMGMAKSCILLVGAKLQILNGNKFKVASCSRSKLFRIGTDDEHRRWTKEIDRTITQLAVKT